MYINVLIITKPLICYLLIFIIILKLIYVCYSKIKRVIKVGRKFPLLIKQLWTLISIKSVHEYLKFLMITSGNTVSSLRRDGVVNTSLLYPTAQVSYLQCVHCVKIYVTVFSGNKTGFVQREFQIGIFIEIKRVFFSLWNIAVGVGFQSQRLPAPRLPAPKAQI